MKKINDMSMLVKDEKILLVKKITQMKSLQIVITSKLIIELSFKLTF